MAKVYRFLEHKGDLNKTRMVPESEIVPEKEQLCHCEHPVSYHRYISTVAEDYQSRWKAYECNGKAEDGKGCPCFSLQVSPFLVRKDLERKYREKKEKKKA